MQHDPTPHSRFLPRLLLVTATLAAGTSIWFLLGEPESVIADEGGANSVLAEHTLAVVAGEAITREEILSLAAADLQVLEQRRQELIKSAVNARVEDRLVELAARSRGLARDEFLADELGESHATADDPAYRALIERLAATYAVEYHLEPEGHEGLGNG